MTDLEAGGAAKPKRASKPRQKKAVSVTVMTPTTGGLTATNTASAVSPTAAKPSPLQGASKSPASKRSAPRAAARPTKFRAAGPHLNDWLSFILLALLIVGAVSVYQWRGEAAKLPAAGQTPPPQMTTPQTAGQPRL
ncbi:hypothetical protein EHF33_13300 [Deinococcus psychrotolerans]|uniref:Uncharacterized protein n=1 Tax=Deinococcus psychrotolerans TaxID=2489213 RepID=A0A3G8YPN8_9DEIO|nr:hypothetical protein [Deinococcus psychrotolerans]AZI43601.1 hypothetical protein EHF33_13300 [Deinococcus psychrotolerans]